MFLMGNFQHSLDDKNRIRLPASFRKDLGDDYFLMPGTNGSIFVYKADETEKLLSQLLSLDSLNPKVSFMLTQLTAFSKRVTADSQGRFLLPDELIERFGIKKDVRIVGGITKALIWSEEAWQEKFGAGLTPEIADDIYTRLDEVFSNPK